jgi:AcrR family transcriptional regulator
VPDGDPFSGLSRRERVRLELLITAERLFAQYGPDGASLRQIAAEAGYAGAAAIQYHFGSKDGVVKAILDYRQPAIDARRIELLDAAPTCTVEVVVEAMARPFLEPESCVEFVAFIARVFNNFEDYPDAYEMATQMPGWVRIRTALDTLLSDVPPDVRLLRISLATLLMLNAIAYRGARLRSHDATPGMSTDEFASELFAAMTAILRPRPPH